MDSDLELLSYMPSTVIDFSVCGWNPDGDTGVDYISEKSLRVEIESSWVT